ncbi:urease accessory protein [Elysia marginata]|uniref:Urease accessory protein n=1 Tax=Elysia marginata TaxID=1093978 RepID=A0AAV4GH85_9GAST|nr:urease accessory protein [Elysia marginata]
MKQPGRGFGHVIIEALRDKPRPDADGFLTAEVVSLSHSYPFRFMIPEDCTDSPCRWIYPVAFGGGLVGGDAIEATVVVGDDCAAVVTTQESTKVYHCHHCGATNQRLLYTVGDQALLCVLPDPVVCFKGANFQQTQVVEMSPNSNLVFLDWMLSGRTALSESWSFQRYLNHVEMRVLGEVVLRELTDLEDSPYKSVADGMMNFQVSGMCIVLGDRVSFLSEALLDKYSRKKDLGERSSPDVVVSVSRVSYTVQGQTICGCYLRFLGATTQKVRLYIEKCV